MPPTLPAQRGAGADAFYGDSDDWLLSLPLFHVSGQGFCGAGCRAEAVSPCVKNSRWSRRYRAVPTPSLVPTQLWRLLNSHHPVALKAVLLGGAEIPVALTEQAREQGIRTFCGYGLTEFASTVCAKEADGAPDGQRAAGQRRSGGER